ncbi:MAG TPA: hypothetical protein VGW75_10275 [Solirubrobacteraceae bacterium]|jgi:hypothetical protein|nr:hypothetical protein [Solirubrobacteraceae bacterium]
MTDPAEALLELARAERRLAAEGHAGELAALHAERDRLLAALPAEPTVRQAEALRLALAIQVETAELLRAARDAVAAELARVDHGRETLRGYAPAGLEPARTFDAAG